MHTHKVALVTGANKGIGYAIASELAARGLTVLVGARDAARGEAPHARGVHRDRRVVDEDVEAPELATDPSRRRRDRRGVGDVERDRAGVAADPFRGRLAAMRRSGAPSEAALDDVRAVFETNVFGVIAVTQAMLPLLRESPAGRVVNLSSRIGSLSAITDPAFPMRGVGGVAYGPSKTALNAVTIAFAQELEGTSVKVNLVCPGHTATDLNGHSGARTVTEAAREPVRLALLGPEGPTGTFSNEDGPIPW